MKTMIISALAAAIATSSAFAQTETQATPPAESTADSATTPGGMMIGDTATVALKFAAMSPADVMASKLEGMEVYNKQNENIGEVEDLVIKDGKTISGVVVSVGGFLGIGERYVLLDPSSIVLNMRDDTMRAYVNTSKDELSEAPAFTYEKRD